MEKYSDVSHVTIYGGVSQKSQVKQLRNGVDIIIATTGRLLDLINQGEIKMEKIEIFTLGRS